MTDNNRSGGLVGSVQYANQLDNQTLGICVLAQAGETIERPVGNDTFVMEIENYADVDEANVLSVAQYIN